MVITSRPRAHSASSIKLNQVLQPERHSVVTASAVLAGSSSSSNYNNSSSGAGARASASASVVGKKLSYSSPELRSMLVGLETTVPQNLNPSHLGSRHKPRRKRGGGKMGGSRASLSTLGRERGVLSGGELEGEDGQEGCCGRCCCLCCRRCCCRCCGGGGGGGRRGGGCRMQAFLVVMQLVVGVGVTGVAVYMYFFQPAFILRDSPIWAGAPLCAAGLLGVCYCASHITDFSKTTRVFVLKILCSVLSIASTVLCATAAIFIGIHLGRIFSYVSCQKTEDDCRCFLPEADDILPRVFVYPGLQDCVHVFCKVKIYLLVVGSLCLVGSLFSLWLAILLWKARYGRFHSGVRLPSVKRRYSVS